MCQGTEDRGSAARIEACFVLRNRSAGGAKCTPTVNPKGISRAFLTSCHLSNSSHLIELQSVFARQPTLYGRIVPIMFRAPSIHRSITHRSEGASSVACLAPSCTLANTHQYINAGVASVICGIARCKYSAHWSDGPFFVGLAFGAFVAMAA